MAHERIAIVGEYQPNFAPHAAIDTAVEHALAADPALPPVARQWVATSDAEHIPDEEFATFAGWWIAHSLEQREGIEGAVLSSGLLRTSHRRPGWYVR